MDLDITTRTNRFAATYFLSEAAMALQAQNYSDAKDDIHLARVRRNLAMVLVPDAEIDDAEEWLLGTIAEAIAEADKSDFDVTYEDQARFVVYALFKHLMPEEGE